MKQTPKPRPKFKTQINFLVDIGMFMLMIAMIATGLMVKYVLIPGYQRQEKFGRNVELLFCGLDRHEWGSVHLIIGIALLILLVFHIAFHWKNITGIYGKIVPSSRLRKLLALLLVLICLVMVIFPFLLGPTVVKKEHGWNKNKTNQELQKR